MSGRSTPINGASTTKNETSVSVGKFLFAAPSNRRPVPSILGWICDQPTANFCLWFLLADPAPCDLQCSGYDPASSRIWSTFRLASNAASSQP